MPARPITFLSDYGLGDEFVGVVHAVIARICPDARVIDVGHGVPRQDVRAGALMLARALPYAPAGVHLAVVDPEVGAQRRAVAVRTVEEGRLLVGPDNGLLVPAAERFGGIAEAVDVSLELVADNNRIGTVAYQPAAAELGVRRLSTERSADQLRELCGLHTADKLRVTIISPGAVESELAETISDPDLKGRIVDYRSIAIPAAAIARAIAFAIEQPAEVDVNEIVIRPTAQPA